MWNKRLLNQNTRKLSNLIDHFDRYHPTHLPTCTIHAFRARYRDQSLAKFAADKQILNT